MSGTWRRILTLKMLALSALILAFAVIAVIAVIHRRHLDAKASLPERHGYPPHVKAGW